MRGDTRNADPAIWPILFYHFRLFSVANAQAFNNQFWSFPRRQDLLENAESLRHIKYNSTWEREREREKQGGRYTHFKVEIYWLHVPSNEILLHGSYNLTRHDAPISPEQLLIFTYFLENSSTIHMFLVHY